MGYHIRIQHDGSFEGAKVLPSFSDQSMASGYARRLYAWHAESEKVTAITVVDSNGNVVMTFDAESARALALLENLAAS
jgi:hypothetical protein